MSYRSRDSSNVATDARELVYLPCRRCTNSTLGTMLAQHGGLCLPCFETYCEPGVKGGLAGFTTGRADNLQQAAMRKRTKAGIAANVLEAA